MEEVIKISVIVPIYKVEKYIERCINSILHQTYGNLEVILVDDGSPDKCPEICDRFKEQDSRVKVIHKKNGGLSDARNAGIDLATGDYIAFVDGDDYISPEMYELMLTACKKNDAQMAMCGRHLVYEDGNLIDDRFILSDEVCFTGGDTVKHLLTYDGCDSAAWDKLYLKILFEDIRYPVGVMSEDYQVTARLMHKCSKIVHVGKALYYYVQRPESITKQAFTKQRYTVLEQVENICDYLLDNLPQLKPQINYFRSYQLISLQRIALKNKDNCLKSEMLHVHRSCLKYMFNVMKETKLSIKLRIIYLIKNPLLLLKSLLI